MRPKESRTVIVSIVNYICRFSDSTQHALTKQQQKQGCYTIYILLQLGGEHKQRVDRQIASELGVPVYQISKSSELESLADVLTKFSTVHVYSQNTVEMRRAAGYIQQYIKRAVNRAFDDCIALDRSKLEFSPVYSVFNKRARKCLKQYDTKASHKPIASNILTTTKLRRVVASGPKVPSLQTTIHQYIQRVQKKYSESRQRFGALFEYDPPSSSFMSIYINTGRVSIRQLWDIVSDSTYKDELLWNQYCLLFIEHYGDSVCAAEYGPYNRQTVKWLGSQKQSSVIQKLLSCSTDEPLINAIMNQLTQTGFVPNRLRMVFASWCFQQRLDWRVAAQLFEQFLIDYSQSSNVFNWLFGYNLVLGRQHVFSIQRQIKKFDPSGEYIRRWLTNSSNK